MQYKTIVLELLRQRPELHDRLRRDQQLLTALETYAKELKEIHEALKEQLSQANPSSAASQISSEALEIALEELKDRLPPESPSDEQE